MPTVIYDPTGASPDNLILNEVITPINEPDIFPAQGAFYTPNFSAVGIKASDGTPVTLQLYVDYIWSPLFASRAAATGREVFSFILLTNYQEWSTVTLNYRAVGGDQDNVLLGQIVAAGAFDRTNIDNWLAFQGEGLMLNPAGVDFTLKNTGVAYLFSSKLNAIATALRTPSEYLNFINTDYLQLSSTVSTLSSQIQAWQADMLNGSFVSMTQVNAAISTALAGFTGGSSLPLAGGTMNAAANITFNGGTILGLPSIFSSNDAAASQGFVLEHASSSNVSGQAVARSTANLTATYNNGTLGVGATLTNNATFAALVLDGHTCGTGEEVLIMDQADATQNGHYVVTISGDAGTAWVLTRTASMDNHVAGQVKAGAIIIVTGGTLHAGTSWTITSQGTGTAGAAIIGTDSIVFGPFNITINLSNYVTNAALTADLASYATLTDLGAMAGSSVPPGTILPFSGTTIPLGFYACPTAPTELSAAANLDLFGAIGGNWQNSTWLPEDIENYASCKLADGRILVCGGTIGGIASKAVYFGTISGDNISWVKSPNVLPRTMTEHTAVTLTNGYVWLAGGWINDVDNPVMSAASCPTYILNIAANSNSFSVINSGNLKGSGGSNITLRGHNATLVHHSGVDQVMVSGGFTSTVASAAPVANVRFYTFNGSWVVANAKDGTALPHGLANHKVLDLGSNKIMVIGGVITNRAVVEQTDVYLTTLNSTATNYSYSWSTLSAVPSAAVEQQAVLLSDGRIFVASCGKTPNPVSYFGTMAGGLTSVTWVANTNPIPDFDGQIALVQHTAGKLALVCKKVYVGTIASNAVTWTSDNASTVFGLPWFPAGYVPVQNPNHIGRTTMGDLMAHTHVDTNHLKFNDATIASNFSWGAAGANISSFVVDKSANLPAGQGVQFIVKY